MRARTCSMLVAAVATASFAAAGCGEDKKAKTLNGILVERGIAQSILEQHKIYTRVSCPRDVEQKKDENFDCKVLLDVGTYPVSVEQTNDKGNVKWSNDTPLITLNMDKVKAGIRTDIREQRKLVASQVECPAAVLQRKGLEFRCTATVKGRKYPFQVTEVDNNGHVEYLGL